MIAGLRRWLHLSDQLDRGDDPIVDDSVLRELEEISRREQARADQLRHMRETGNWVEEALMGVPPPRSRNPRRKGMAT